MKQLILMSLVSVLSLGIIACETKEDPETVALKEELQELRQEREEARLAQEALEKEQEVAESEKEKQELKERVDSLNSKLEELENKKPVVVKPSTPKNNDPVVGPGNANAPVGPSSGTATVFTKSANGSLTLRRQPGTKSEAVLGDTGKPVTIPNGTSLQFESYHQLNNYTWYKVKFPEGGGFFTGWVRGDYLNR